MLNRKAQVLKYVNAIIQYAAPGMHNQPPPRKSREGGEESISDRRAGSSLLISILHVIVKELNQLPEEHRARVTHSQTVLEPGVCHHVEKLSFEIQF